MNTYRPEGLDAFRAYEAAVGEEHAMAHELAQCAKIDVYNLIAPGIFERVGLARTKTLAAFKMVEKFKT